MIDLLDYIRVQGKVLAIAGVGALLLLGVEFTLTHFFHIFYIASTVIGLAVSFEWNINAQILLKIIPVAKK